MPGFNYIYSQDDLNGSMKMQVRSQITLLLTSKSCNGFSCLKARANIRRGSAKPWWSSLTAITVSLALSSTYFLWQDFCSSRKLSCRCPHLLQVFMQMSYSQWALYHHLFNTVTQPHPIPSPTRESPQLLGFLDSILCPISSILYIFVISCVYHLFYLLKRVSFMQVEILFSSCFLH